MASSIVLRVANFTSTIVFARTDQEVGTILRLFNANFEDVMPEELTTQAQQNQWQVDKANERIVTWVRQTARSVRLRQLKEASTDETTATADTSL